MPCLVSEAALMALSCLLLVGLSAVYPVTAIGAGLQARSDTRTEAGAIVNGLPETMLNDYNLQVSNLRLRKQGEHSNGRALLSDHQTLAPGSCTGKDISIRQNPGGTSGSGISEFKVEILNNCACPVSNIHVNCGEFASAEPLSPDVFKRVAMNDCLVNGGKPVPHATLIAFTYANSNKYPLSFKSATFC